MRTPEERKEYKERLAFNRWQIRQEFKTKLFETATDDQNYAEELIQKEERGT
jgi:hypothetical protein